MCFCTVNRWVISLLSAEKGKPYQNLTSYNLACCCYKTQHGICAGAGCWELRTNYLWLQSKNRWQGRLGCPMFYQSRVVVVNLSVRCFLLVDVICVSQCACPGVIQEWTPKADFTHHAHTAAITTVAASERFVVTGSKDETIQLYDMKKRVEHGVLLHHNGMSCSTSGCNCHSFWSNFTCILECNSCPYWCHIWDWSGSETLPVTQAPSPLWSFMGHPIYWAEERTDSYACGTRRSGSVWSPSERTSMQLRTLQRLRFLCRLPVGWGNMNPVVLFCFPEDQWCRCPSILLANSHLRLGQTKLWGEIQTYCKF